MRALFALGLLALGVAGLTAASAADLPAGRIAYTTRHVGVGVRTGQIVIYDYQSGVRVRAYWRAPWRHRHYYPTGNGKLEGARDDDASDGVPSPAAFYREWSNASAFALPETFYPEPPRTAPRPVDPEPDARNGPPQRFTDPAKP